MAKHILWNTMVQGSLTHWKISVIDSDGDGYGVLMRHNLGDSESFIKNKQTHKSIQQFKCEEMMMLESFRNKFIQLEVQLNELEMVMEIILTKLKNSPYNTMVLTFH